MKSIAISGSPRENVGKRDAKELRYEGLVPAVLYGGKTQTHFSVSAADLKPVIYTPVVHFIDITVGSTKAQAIIQDIQFPPLTEQILHVDFSGSRASSRVGVRKRHATPRESRCSHTGPYWASCVGIPLPSASRAERSFSNSGMNVHGNLRFKI